MRYFIGLFFLLCLVSCKHENEKRLTPGSYRGVLQAKDLQEIPFIFKVENDTLLKIYNAQEVITVDEISYFKDSVKIQLPYFEGFIKAKIHNDSLFGHLYKPSLDRVIKFKAYSGQHRFLNSETALVDISGNWQTIFHKEVSGDEYIAKGIFSQTGNKVEGTFRTTTGDYRYLEGQVHSDSLVLSTFDGAHAFLFKAKVSDSLMQGVFYSDNHWKETFTAKLNNDYMLPEAEGLTYLKEGYQQFSFSFPNTNGMLVSSNDPEFDDKVMVVQLMGSWCPNCMDESKFLVNYLRNNPNPNVKVVGIAFEIAKTRSQAYQSIKRFKDRIGIPYPVVLADFGRKADKETASKKLPMLNAVLSYPTTIFIDKNKKVRKIHTGFNGPATGKPYEDFKKEFDQMIKILINE